MSGLTAAAATGALLAAVGVSRAYAGVQALREVSLQVRAGEVLGLIGPNGAGKSTLVNILTGYDQPDTGTITLDGVDVTRRDARDRVRRGVARTFQHGHLFGGLTVRENLEVAALATRRTRRQASDDASGLLSDSALAVWADHPATALPHGVERRVGVARALATRPRILLLDEPAAGLNEGEIEEFGASIRRLATDLGMGVLLIDHNMALVMAVCDRVHVLVQGASFLEGNPTEVRASPAVAEAYLGRSGRAAER